MLLSSDYELIVNLGLKLKYRSLPSSRLLETDAMKSYNLESKYPEGRKSPSRDQAREKAGAMSLYESSPLHTYNQAQAALSARDRASSLHDLAGEVKKFIRLD